jgi:hypothetical protein
LAIALNTLSAWMSDVVQLSNMSAYTPANKQHIADMAIATICDVGVQWRMGRRAVVLPLACTTKQVLTSQHN